MVSFPAERYKFERAGPVDGPSKLAWQCTLPVCKLTALFSTYEICTR